MELNYGIFVSVNKQLFITIYDDDLLIFGSDLPRLEDVQQKLWDQFKMIDLGDVSHYLRMQINYVVGEKSLFTKVPISKRYLTVLR